MHDSMTFVPRRNMVTSGKLWWRKFMIRLRHWEYWPIYIFNFPVAMIWFWNAIRTRHLFFFTMTNPGIPTGGFFGESKSDILQHIPDRYKPKTVLWKKEFSTNDLDIFLDEHQLAFPIIVKPEVGERGWLISITNILKELKEYLDAHPIDMILQPFLDWPMEVSIMTYRIPGETKAVVTSICRKEFLHVTGDGISTLEELILQNERAVLQYGKLAGRYHDQFHEILPAGKKIILEKIGNHCRGTKFIDCNEEIDETITRVMKPLLFSMPGVYYGRFDMKIRSWESLRAGRDIAVLEFNGTSSDPAHIYDPGYSLWKAYRDIFFHWGIMARIALLNHRAGVESMSFKEIISSLKLYFRHKRTN